MFALAQVVAGGWGIGQIAISIIIVLAVVGIVIIAARVFQIPIPQWVWQIVGIVIVACVSIVAIRFLLGM